MCQSDRSACATWFASNYFIKIVPKRIKRLTETSINHGNGTSGLLNYNKN